MSDNRPPHKPTGLCERHGFDHSKNPPYEPSPTAKAPPGEPQIGETWMVTKVCKEHKGFEHIGKPWTFKADPALRCRGCTWERVLGSMVYGPETFTAPLAPLPAAKATGAYTQGKWKQLILESVNSGSGCGCDGICGRCADRILVIVHQALLAGKAEQKRESDSFKAVAENWQKKHLEVSRVNAELRNNLALAVKALEKYGHHLKSCNPFYSGDEVKCGCGYAAALRHLGTLSTESESSRSSATGGGE